jgi:hypothetical protein
LLGNFGVEVGDGVGEDIFDVGEEKGMRWTVV